MRAKSIKGTSSNEIATAFDESMADGFTPTLVILFLSIKQDRVAVTEVLDKKGVSVFGATPAGKFIDGELKAGSIVLLLLDINPTYFKIQLEEATEETLSTTAKKIAETAKHTFNKPAFLIAATLFTNAEVIVNAIEEEFENEVTLFGAQAVEVIGRLKMEGHPVLEGIFKNNPTTTHPIRKNGEPWRTYCRYCT